MIVPVVQRWKNGRDRYRPAGEVLDTSRYEIAEMVHDRQCKEFVCRNHYSRSYPAARFRYRADVLAESDDSRERLYYWLPLLTRSVRHKGNHKYLWVFNRKIRKRLPKSLAYPKVLDSLSYQGIKMRQDKLIWM